ncbi:hypothetical protein BDW72DRAFT_188410 [Aspergillus terricola var. indicus]
MFMSRVPGDPLDKLWKFLDEHQKSSIRDQLDDIVKGYKAIPAPITDETNAVFGGGNPRRCKDARRELRVADYPISNESEFNQFISSNPQRTETEHIAMIRSYLKDDHEVVMTHGDLHPRNIMITIISYEREMFGRAATADQNVPPGAEVLVTGIIDSEMCGWYPAYWEYVKALNTIGPGDGFGDWYKYLPQSIGVWPREHAVDLMLSRWHG